MHNFLSREDGDAPAASCLLSDFCDNWRSANGLTDADYFMSHVRKLHCPLYSLQLGEAEVSAGYNLRHCYMSGADGFNLVYREASKLEQMQLPFPEEEVD